jgi:cytochrome b6-f complex iron-sulfur subunit
MSPAVLLLAMATSTQGFIHPARAMTPAAVSRAHRMSIAEADPVPDMDRRVLMNALLVGTLAVPGAWLAGGYASFFLPPGASGGASGVSAHDALGDDVFVAKWLAGHPTGSRALVEGLNGDATYLIVDKDNTLAKYALNAICTHLGCVVPWNAAQNKFICPCHGSQYDSQGTVVRGPAPLPLALAHVNTDPAGKVILSKWKEEDFRSNSPPWWK